MIPLLPNPSETLEVGVVLPVTETVSVMSPSVTGMSVLVAGLLCVNAYPPPRTATTTTDQIAILILLAFRIAFHIREKNFFIFCIIIFCLGYYAQSFHLILRTGPILCR